MSDAIDLDKFLSHHGIKGMHWGKTTGGAAPTSSGGSGGSAKSSGSAGSSKAPSARSVKKAEKKAAGEADDKAILTARANLKKQDAKLGDLAVKAVSAKTEKGRNSANDSFNKLAEKYDNDPQHIKASEQTGKERMKAYKEIAGWGALAIGLAVAGNALKYA